MRHLDLFSGLGGFSLAASWVWGDEHEIVSFCDNEPAAQVVLKKHWPEVPIHGDIKTLDATRWRGTVDLVTGGFPCQPFSCAGKRRGKEDDRHLWPEMLRVIKECQPRWVLGENVLGIVNMELESVYFDLEGEGYEIWPLVIPACGVDAPHRRYRVWIVAHDNIEQAHEQRSGRRESCGLSRGSMDAREETARQENGETGNNNAARLCADVADASRERLSERYAGENCGWPYNESTGENRGRHGTTWPTEPDVGRVANGVPYRVDRLRLLGNAIVPQVAEQIMRGMKAVDAQVDVRPVVVVR